MWRVKSVSCDGGKIGKTDEEWFFTSEEKASLFLKNKVEELNNASLNRTDISSLEERKRCEQENKKWFRLYFEDTVEDQVGYCNWAYSNMLVLDEVTIED